MGFTRIEIQAMDSIRALPKLLGEQNELLARLVACAEHDSSNAEGDATNMAVAIRLALRFLPRPEEDDDGDRACGTAALQGALSAHERRLLIRDGLMAEDKA